MEQLPREEEPDLGKCLILNLIQLDLHQGPLLLTGFNFNPIMDK